MVVVLYSCLGSTAGWSGAGYDEYNPLAPDEDRADIRHEEAPEADETFAGVESPPA